MQSEPKIDPNVETLIRDVVIGSPVARHLGIQVVCLSMNRVVLELPFSARNVTIRGIVHGGVIATLIDAAAAAASVSGVCDIPKRGATSNLSIAYLAPADGTNLVAEAIVLRRGRYQVVEEVRVRDATGNPIAKALATSRIG